jgi:hypothetical protein
MRSHGTGDEQGADTGVDVVGPFAKRSSMVRVGLERDDAEFRGQGVVERIDTHRFAHRTERPQQVDRGMECGLHIGLHRGERGISEHTESHSRDVAAQQRGVIDRSAGHGREGVGAVGHGSAERTKVVERHRERLDTDEAHQAIRGLQAHRAAQRSRNADRASRVGAEADGHQAGTNRCPRAAARPAGYTADVPRIGGRCRHDTAGEFMGGGLPRHQRTGRAQVADHLCVVVLRRVGVERRTTPRGKPRHVDDVLHADEHPVQRTAIDARGEIGVGPVGLGQ